jgi:ketosteroid isomerase-like protein
MSTTTVKLEAIVAEHVAAVNAFDTDAIVVTFADDALVDDAHPEFWGKDAIQRWVAKEIVGDRVTIEVTEVIDHYGQTIVRGRTTASTTRPTSPTS